MDSMTDVADLTESLLSKTKSLLKERGDLRLEKIAEDTGVGIHWLRSVRYRPENNLNPSAKKLEVVYRYMTEYHAARRFQRRQAEARAQ